MDSMGDERGSNGIEQTPVLLSGLRTKGLEMIRLIYKLIPLATAVKVARKPQSYCWFRYYKTGDREYFGMYQNITVIIEAYDREAGS